MALSAVSAVLRRAGLGKLSRLDRPEPANRYEHPRPGGLLHLDVKKLGRILSPCHRVVGHRRSRKKVGPKRLGAAGWEFVHVSVDDATLSSGDSLRSSNKRACWGWGGRRG
jgi:hypothetical protein